MKLITEDIAKALPPLYSTDETPAADKTVVCKFFQPWGAWTWYVVEGNREPDGDWTFLGYVEGHDSEWGLFTLYELEHIRGPGGLRIERDIHFEPKPFKEIKP